MHSIVSALHHENDIMDLKWRSWRSLEFDVGRLGRLHNEWRSCTAGTAAHGLPYAQHMAPSDLILSHFYDLGPDGQVWIRLPPDDYAFNY
jgi:hypothetical protein